MHTLRDRVVLVTGAGRGAGRALALGFAEAGARVAANDLTPINLDETVRLAAAAGHSLAPYIADVAKSIPLQTMLGQVTQDLGPIWALVNCANVEPGQALLYLDEWDWDRTLAVNLKGPFLLTQALARQMKAGAGGVILQVLSRSKELSGQAVALASKGGLLAFTRQAAAELAAYNIRVYALLEAGAGLALPDLGPPSSELDRPPKALPHEGGLVQWALYLCSNTSADWTEPVVSVQG